MKKYIEFNELYAIQKMYTRKNNPFTYSMLKLHFQYLYTVSN